jgi:hypothetical protein
MDGGFLLSSSGSFINCPAGDRGGLPARQDCLPTLGTAGNAVLQTSHATLKIPTFLVSVPGTPGAFWKMEPTCSQFRLRVWGAVGRGGIGANRWRGIPAATHT